MAEQFFISCPKGVEALLADEFAAFGFEQIKQTVGGIFAEAPFFLSYRACLHSRFANRIIWVLLQEDVLSKEQFYKTVNALPWSSYFSVEKTFSVDSKGVNRYIKNSQFAALLVKDAIVDYFNEQQETRPSIDTKNPDVRIYAHVKRQRLLLGIDISGGSLHRRGYRSLGAKAPLKENLAAALVKRIPKAASATTFVDPMCGSGTLLIEAIYAKLNLPSQIHREQFGFEALQRFDAAQWQKLKDDAHTQMKTAIDAAKAQGIQAVGYDTDTSVIKAAKENIHRAGLSGIVSCKQQALKDFKTEPDTENAILLCNPPYGERLQDRDRLFALYQLLGQHLKQHCQGWQAAILSSDDFLLKALSLQKSKSYRFYNGALDVQWLIVDIFKQKNDHQEAVVDDKFLQAVEMVSNRLRKNKKAIERWANKNNIECYRLYDADMPEYAFALDCYQGRYQITEYAAPKSVDKFAAYTRKQHFEKAVQTVFEQKPTALYFKKRQRQKGNEQYQRLNESKHFFSVQEGMIKAYVNLRDYLDTGLFLDHRPVRLMLAEKARGKRFLNLFSYTSVASLHAIAGGATHSVSVDMSGTYTQWTKKNFALNKVDVYKHQIVQADVLKWLEKADDSFDVIFLDPPSFSNSKRMEQTFDVQRDQKPLIDTVMKLLAKDGQLIFSNNHRGFKLSSEITDHYDVVDITKKTIDEDFKRNPKIHQCWQLTHKKS